MCVALKWSQEDLPGKVMSEQEPSEMKGSAVAQCLGNAGGGSQGPGVERCARGAWPLSVGPGRGF